jgi:hypothetical protein
LHATDDLQCNVPEHVVTSGKEDALRGSRFDDQLRSFSCLGVLHNAIVAWNIKRVGQLAVAALAGLNR